MDRRRPTLWYVAGIALALVFLLVALKNSQPTQRLLRPRPDRTTIQDWSYDAQRDALNPALSAAQCDLAFPHHSRELERAAGWYASRNLTIRAEDVALDKHDSKVFRMFIHDNQLRVLEAKRTWGDFWGPRAVFFFQLFERALLGAAALGEKLPSVEFSMFIDDRPNMPSSDAAPKDTHLMWGSNRNFNAPQDERVWLLPDFEYWKGPAASSWDEMQRRAWQHDAPFTSKIPKVLWRGVKHTNRKLRGPLLDVTKDQEWADVVEVDWARRENFIDLDDHCRYAFLVHTEGVAWSGRIKYLWNCDSLLFIHDLYWDFHLAALLVPDGPHQNYVPVRRDFADLEEKVQYYLAHPDDAQRIIRNSVNTFRPYTSTAAQACYLRQMIRTYSTMAFQPEISETVSVDVSGQSLTKIVTRGQPFAEWLYVFCPSRPGLSDVFDANALLLQRPSERGSRRHHGKWPLRMRVDERTAPYH